MSSKVSTPPSRLHRDAHGASAENVIPATPSASALLLARLAWGFSLVCAVTLVGLATWGLDRGLDMTDEGYYLLAYQPRQPPTWGLSRFDVFEKALLGWMAPTAINLRAIHLGLVLVSSLVLAAGLAHFLGGSRSSIRRTAMWLPFIVVAQMAAYAFGPPALSYNHITVFLLMISLGATLAYLAKESDQRLLLAVFSGLPLGVCLFIKGSSSVTAFAFTLVAVTLAGRTSTRLGWARGAAALAVGYLLGVGFYFLVVESPGTWWSAFSRDLGGPSAVGPSPASLLHSYADTAYELAKWLLEAGLFLLAGVLVHRQRDRIGSLLRTTIWLTLAAAAAFWVFWRLPPREVLLPLAYLVAIEVVLAVAIATHESLHGVWHRHSTRFWLACMLTVAIPICGAVGTNNNIMLQSTFLLGSWAAALVLTTSLVSSRLRPWTIAFVIVIIGGLSTAKFVDDYVIHPYRLVGGLADQTTSIAIAGPLSHIHVDPETAHFFDQLAVVRREYNTTGQPMVGMYRIPGVILALGGYAPGFPYIIPEIKAFACRELERLRPIDPILLIIRHSTEGPPLGCLAASGIQLARYRQVASIYDPYQSRKLDIYEAPQTASRK